MARKAARKAEVNDSQAELLHDVKFDLNPFWSSSLFSDVYLKNDLPKDHKEIWEDDEFGPFYDFYQGFINLCHDLDHEAFDSWREADTVKNWIVPVMNLLGWENNSERHQNSYIDNTSFTVEEASRKHVYRPDLIYFDQPQHKSYTQKEKDNLGKLREVRDKKTGAKIVVEAKYWDRLSTNTDRYKSKEMDDSASGLGPELQTLRYMEIFGLDFGILTDGKTWRLFHKDLSQGIDRRCFEFDLGNLREVALNILSGNNEQKYRNYAKYFFYFFSKRSLVQEHKDKTNPFVYQVLEYSKKYAYSIEGDLKKRFIISMGLTCNALKLASEELGTSYDLEMIRNVAESHLFNILFTKSCEVRRVLPIQSTNYLKVSLHEVIEYLTEMKFDPDKDWDDYIRDFQFGDAFGGKKFTYEGYDIFNRFINLYEIIHDGTSKSKDFGFEIQGFKESIFSKEEWRFAKKHKIKNRDMINILFNLNFIESKSPDRKFQQIPYSYFTPRQLGSIYESFLEYRLEIASDDMVFNQGQWKTANLKSNHVKNLKLADHHSVKKGDLFFSPNNSDRKMTGSYYTPDNIVEYVVKETLSPLVNNLKCDELLKIRICDPTMGSGHFLSGALDYLVKVYRQKWCDENNDDIDETLTETSKKILHSCLFGSDVNPRAVKLASMSLWLLSASAGKKLESLEGKFVQQDTLIPFTSNYRGGFKQKFDKYDAIIGNPPWDKVKFDEEEFFKNFTDKLSSKKVSKSEKIKIYDSLLANKEIKSQYTLSKSMVEARIEAIKNEFYELQEYSGGQRARFIDFNLYKLAVEKFLKMLNSNGRLGLVVPTGLFGDLGCSGIRKYLFENTSVEQIVGFAKNAKIFEISQPFCMFILSSNGQTEHLRYIDNLMASDFSVIHERLYSSPTIDLSLIKRLSPEAYSVPCITDSLSMNIFDKVFKYIARVGSIDLNVSRELHQTDDAKYITSKKNKYPIVKGDEIDHFTFRGGVKQFLTSEGVIRFKKRLNSSKKKLAFRAISGTTDPRRLVAAIIPEGCLTINSIVVSALEHSDDEIYFYQALSNSRVIDFIFRLISKNNNVNKYAVSMLPIPIFDVENKDMLEISKLSKKISEGFSIQGYEKLDDMVMSLVGLSKTEKKYLADQILPAAVKNISNQKKSVS